MLARVSGAGVLEGFLELEEGEVQRVVVDHSDDQEFALAGDPHVTVDGGGVIMTVDVSGTDGGQFALICQRVNASEYPSGEDNDVSYTWVRVGVTL